MRGAIWMGVFAGILIAVGVRFTARGEADVVRTYRWGDVPVGVGAKVAVATTRGMGESDEKTLRVYDVEPLMTVGTEEGYRQITERYGRSPAAPSPARPARVPIPLWVQSGQWYFRANGTIMTHESPELLLHRSLHSALQRDIRLNMNSDWYWGWSGRVVMLLDEEEHAVMGRALGKMEGRDPKDWWSVASYEFDFWREEKRLRPLREKR